MKADVKAKWVAALKSGEYSQAKHALRTPEGFCCLGVLCDLYVKENPLKARWVEEDWPSSIVSLEYEDSNFNTSLEGGVPRLEGGVLPNPVKEWAGLDDTNPFVEGRRKLSHLNDEGMTFPEIADKIQEKL